MSVFGPAMILGLCLGFMWGTGCSLAILYSIYLGGYRKAVEDSLAPVKTKRFKKALARVEARLEAKRLQKPTTSESITHPSPEVRSGE